MMLTKRVALMGVGLAAAMLLATPVFAAKALLSDEAIENISGNANDFTFKGGSNALVALALDASATVQLGWYQWTDNHAGDSSINKTTNDQSGYASQVQQDIGGKANALIVGAASQNVLNNNGVFVAGNQTNRSYAVFAGGGF